MTTFKKLFLFFLMIITCIYINNVFANESEGKSRGTDYVFLQTASSGNIIYNKNTNTYKLTLKNIDPSVMYFSSSGNRRVTGNMGVREFINTWKKGAEVKQIKDNGMLNSAIVAVRSDNKGMIKLAVALMPPVYNNKDHSITYAMQEIKDGKMSHQSPNQYKSFKHVSVFIDDICISCIGGGF